jgi:hypothetical protein
MDERRGWMRKEDGDIVKVRHFPSGSAAYSWMKIQGNGDILATWLAALAFLDHTFPTCELG